MIEDIKRIIDGVSLAGVLACLADYLPAAAAGASLIWTIIRIYETKTVQGWIKKPRRSP